MYLSKKTRSSADQLLGSSNSFHTCSRQQNLEVKEARQIKSHQHNFKSDEWVSPLYYYLCWSWCVGQSLDYGCKLARLGQDHCTALWAPTTPSSKINIQEAKVPWFHTSATRWRSKGAPVQLDQTEEQKEALSLHDSTRSAIGFRGKSGISKAVTRLGPRSITSYFTNNWPPICFHCALFETSGNVWIELFLRIL